MAKLILKFNNEVIDHIDVVQGDMKMGRKPTSDVVLDNLAVSGTHANIFTIGEDSFVQDMGSTNGTFVNNKKITKHHLRNGDVISIGKHSLIFVSEVTQQESTEDFAKTVVINPSAFDTPKPAAAKPRHVDTMETEVSKTSKEDRIGALFVLSGANSGKRIELTKSMTSLGRAGKRAGVIRRTDNGYMLLHAENEAESPRLNGKPLSANGTELENGDIIEVSGSRLQFYLK
ncbi:MAG TPA: FHA domain-containing protein [Acidiferrobacteraceae bacterium]|nr:FHA domain-containing protein [Acidiferrobacteraceae bacterium]HEX20642.1 FHA domain-containing protein [Acidiferrobacteraceae bacterium]